VQAARKALDEGPWGRTTAAERAAAMRRFADALAARAEATSTLVTRENGMPIGLSSAFNGAAPAGLLQMYAGLIEQMTLEEVRPSQAGATIVRREPVGVVGGITPWNYPQVLAMMKIAPALAAGCTIVLKPSPETALDSYVFGDAAIEAGLPPGVLNIVLAGREAGSALVSHPGVDKVAFTGSTAAGRIIGAECGRLIRRVTLELGGKSAAIVLDDADLDVIEAAATATRAWCPAAGARRGRTAAGSSSRRSPRRVRTATIGVNYHHLDLGSLFGGMKDSGLGRELGPRGAEQLPRVQVDLRKRKPDEWLTNSPRGIPPADDSDRQDGDMTAVYGGHVPLSAINGSAHPHQ
jgi:acyl-CoA reductase-like NAD-dependent aldehyde dehydrogenase